MRQDKIKDSYINIYENFYLTWKIFITNWKVFSVFLFAINLPCNFLSTILNQLTQDKANTFVDFLSTLLLLLWILNIASFGATSIITEDTINKQKISNYKTKIKSGIIRSLNRIIFVIFDISKAMIIVYIGFLLFIIPGIYLSVKYIFVQQAILLRDSKSSCCLPYSKFDDNSIDYSVKLVKGNWWKVFKHLVALIFVLMFILCISFLIEIVFILLISSITNIDTKILLDSVIHQIFVGSLVYSTLISSICYLLVIYLTVLFLNLDYLTQNNQS